MPRPFRIGVAGCGWIFRERYAPLFTAWPEDVEVVAICDLHAPAREAALVSFPGALAFSDPAEMLAQSQLDALFVLTKESANAATATLALRAGIPVFLEKPPAVSVREWQELRAVEEETGRPVYTAFNRRHSPCLLKERQAGPVTRIHGKFNREGRVIASFPFTAIHMLDAIAYLGESEFGEMQVTFGRPPRPDISVPVEKPHRVYQHWTIMGILRNGVLVSVSADPDWIGSQESLTVSRSGEVDTIDFPTDARFPVPPQARDLGDFMAERTKRYLIELEETDFGRCLRDFLSYLGHGNWHECPHRLARCGSVIRVMEQMIEAYRKSGHGTPPA